MTVIPSTKRELTNTNKYKYKHKCKYKYKHKHKYKFKGAMQIVFFPGVVTGLHSYPSSDYRFSFSF